MNKRGGAEAIFLIAAVPIVILAFFATWIFVHGMVTDTLVNIETAEGQPNISDIAQDTIVHVDDGIQFLRIIAFVIFFGLILSFLIISTFLKSHPYLYIVYVLVSLFGTIVSVYISNAYTESLLSIPNIGDVLQTFTVMNFVMQNLPFIVGSVGLIGAILLFINLPRDGGLTEIL